MKKITSFILLCLLSFNWFGYRLMVNYMQDRNDVILEASFDKNFYDESQLIELKIPLNLAYQNATSSYERCDGEVEYKGTFYKYVKRKVGNDTLYLKCINNSIKSTLEVAKSDFFKNSNDLNQQESKQHNHKNTTIKNSISDFDNAIFSFQSSLTFYTIKSIYHSTNENVVLSPFSKFNGQPPDFI